MYTPEFLTKMKERLIKEKTAREEQLNQLRPHTEIGNNLDDAPLEYEEDNLNTELIEETQKELDKIIQALQKLDNGTYGYDDSGQEIGEKRLEAIPWADSVVIVKPADEF